MNRHSGILPQDQESFARDFALARRIERERIRSNKALAARAAWLQSFMLGDGRLPKEIPRDAA